VNTEQLVNVLSQDATRQSPPGRRLLSVLLPAGTLVAIVFVLWVGLRPDLAAAFSSPRFDFKVLLNATLAVAAAGLVLRLARPAASLRGWGAALWIVPGALLVAVVVELLLLPRAQWWTLAWGHNATWCLRIIPLLALVPLLVSLMVLRAAAPTHPARAGAMAGLMSAGIAGTLYALHCIDDSPLFVGLWYVLAAGIVTATGALLGARWLRW
jgi:hypothetical protein